MDEENNQEQEERNLPEQALEAGKDMAKDAAKNAAKEAGKEIGKQFAKFAIKILLVILKYILPILIAVIITVGIVYVIKDSITKISSTVSTVLKIGDNGPIAPTKEEMLDEIEEELKNMGISKTDLDMGNEAQADAYLYKFKMASLATELPYIAESPAKKLADIYLDVTGGILYDILDSIKGEPLQGIVKIKKRTDDGNTIDLKFKKYEDFKKLIESNDSSASNYFSIDDDWMLCVAKTTTVTTTKDSEDASTIVTMDEVKIPYKTMISNYTIPFSFLMTLQQFTGCAEYVSAVCDLIMYDGEIELTIFESTQEMIVEESDTAVYNSKWVETKEVDDEDGEGTHTEEESHRSSEAVTENTKTVSKFTTITADVTKADVWVYDRDVTYKLNEETTYPLGENGTTTTLEDEPEPEGDTGSWKTGQSQTTKETDITKTWVQEDSKMEIEPDKFLGLWRNALGTYDQVLKLPFKRDGIDVKYGIPFISERKRPTENLFSAEAMFYDILERNEETQLHAKIMKELINYYKTGEKLDISSIFSIFEDSDFTEFSYSTGFDVHDESIFITDVETLKKAFKGYSNNAKLIENAQAFLDMQDKYKVNALFAASVSIVETGAGTAGNAVNGLHNWFNMTGRDGPYVTKVNSKGHKHDWRKYGSDKEGIEAFGIFISGAGANKRYYAAGNYTVDAIGHIYCPNDPPDYPTQGDDWVADTTAQISKFYKAAGIDISEYLSSASYTGGKDLNSLFPNGIPTSSQQMQQYLTQVPIVINNKQGKQETRNLTVHKAVAADVKKIFEEIQASGFKAYDVACFAWRNMVDSSSRSAHSYGVAIDINPNENYMIKKNGTIVAGSLWKPGINEYSITPNGTVVKAFTSRGWTWGGTWSSKKDYMHFSLTGH